MSIEKLYKEKNKLETTIKRTVFYLKTFKLLLIVLYLSVAVCIAVVMNISLALIIIGTIFLLIRFQIFWIQKNQLKIKKKISKIDHIIYSKYKLK